MHNWPKLLLNPSGLLFTFYLCSNLRQVDTLSTDNRQSKFSHTATNSGPSLSQQLALVNNTPCQEQKLSMSLSIHLGWGFVPLSSQHITEKLGKNIKISVCHQISLHKEKVA